MNFPLCLSDSQWLSIATLLPTKNKGTYELRSIITALFYLTKTGCQWRNLPPCFPPWQTVYYHFRRLKSLGSYWTILSKLRETLRIKKGRNPQPTIAIIDSQSVRTSGGVAQRKGWDGAKKLKGRERHLVTDTLGLPLALRVGSATATDRGGLAMLAPYLERSYNRLAVIYTDRAYAGPTITDIPLKIVERADAGRRWRQRAGLKPGEKRGFSVVKKRWVVERSFAWLINYRRLAKDYEKRSDCSEAMIAFIAIMMQNLAAPC